LEEGGGVMREGEAFLEKLLNVLMNSVSDMM
jgi:hypothetical protein